MKKRPLGWMLTGLVIAGIAAVAAPGCGRSVAGEYRRICVASCESGDDCEDYAGFTAVDRDDCIDDCAEEALEFEDNVLDLCDDGVDIDGAQLDRCNDAILQLGAACRDDDESEIAESVGDIVDECGESDLYKCR